MARLAYSTDGALDPAIGSRIACSGSSGSLLPRRAACGPIRSRLALVSPVQAAGLVRTG